MARVNRGTRESDLAGEVGNPHARSGSAWVCWSAPLTPGSENASGQRLCGYSGSTSSPVRTISRFRGPFSRVDVSSRD
jgi:hypothetical protein